jgi:phosphoribosyl 1,2-cyclic phosphodiesterase
LRKPTIQTPSSHIAQGHELVPTEAARMIGHDVARPGPEEAVTVYDRDGLKISAFLVNHDPVEPAYGYRIEYGGRAATGGERRHGARAEHGALLEGRRRAGT